ncbi:MAG: response regulator [Proteobacteria bacterium]|nr:response regulator [Pseudomonadota bacterium]
MNESAASNRPLVLVVDDDPAVRVLINATLEAGGYRICEVGDGRSAISRFAEIEPDIVLLDVMMPGIDGFDTCRKIRQTARGKFTPILMLTALDDAESIERAYEAGATDFETKPVRPRMLVKRLEHMLRAKATGEALRASEQRFKLLTEYAPEAIVVFDYDSGRIVDVNRNAIRIFKLEREALLRANVVDLAPDARSAAGDSRHPLRRALDQAIAGKAPAFSWQFVNGEGRQVWCEARMIRISDAAEPLVRLSLVDISKERRREHEAAQLGRIVEESLNEIYIFRADTLKYVFVNSGARTNLGYSMAELHALTPLDLEHLFTRDSLETLIEPLRDRSRRCIGFSTEHRRKDGSTYPVEVDLQLTEYKDRPAFVANVVDVSEYRETEAALRQAQKMEAVGQLTGGVAHDFNNLLTVVIGNLELLEETTAWNSEQQLLMHDALESARRGAELTRRLLAFARKQILEPKVTEINTLVDSMLQLLRRTLGEPISIELANDTQTLLAKVDVPQLESAILNLAINARDAMPEGGKLTIETRAATSPARKAYDDAGIAPGDYAVLSVSDTGTGIEPDLLGRVFDPFVTTKEIGKGSGLGLSMVYGFVKQSDGYVTIDSEPGRGTRVDLYFPLVRPAELPAEQSGADTGKNVPTGEETILVVEDDAAVRALAMRMLGKLGYRLLEAESGAAALDILDSGRPVDLMFTDIVMRGISGIELADKAHELRPRLKVLFTTGYSDSNILSNRLLANAASLIGKPYGQEALGNAVRDALDAKDPVRRHADAGADTPESAAGRR